MCFFFVSSFTVIIMFLCLFSFFFCFLFHTYCFNHTLMQFFYHTLLLFFFIVSIKIFMFFFSLLHHRWSCVISAFSSVSSSVFYRFYFHQFNLVCIIIVFCYFLLNNALSIPSKWSHARAPISAHFQTPSIRNNSGPIDSPQIEQGWRAFAFHDLHFFSETYFSALSTLSRCVRIIVYLCVCVL